MAQNNATEAKKCEFLVHLDHFLKYLKYLRNLKNGMHLINVELSQLLTLGKSNNAVNAISLANSGVYNA